MRCFQMVLRGSELRNSYLYYTHAMGYFSKNVCQLTNWKSAGFFPKKKPLSGFIGNAPQTFVVLFFLLQLMCLILASNITHLTHHQLICYEGGTPPTLHRGIAPLVLRDVGCSYLVPLLLLYNTNKKTPCGVFVCQFTKWKSAGFYANRGRI